MKIISPRNIRDYYDNAGCSTYCGASEVKFIRKQRTEYEPADKCITNFGGRHLDSFQAICIGFCGVIYRAYRTEDHRLYFYSKQDFVKTNPGYTHSTAWYTHRLSIPKDCDRGKFNELFLKYKTPYFAVVPENRRACRIEITPLLKDLQFYKVMHPVQAYQEIEMFFGSTLTEREDPSQITDDKVLAAAKGFDVITSFRRDKHHSKPRKRRKNK